MLRNEVKAHCVERYASLAIEKARKNLIKVNRTRADMPTAIPRLRVISISRDHSIANGRILDILVEESALSFIAISHRYSAIC